MRLIIAFIYLFTERDERRERKKIMKKKIKRKEPVIESEAESSSINTEDISDVEDYIGRNQELWKYYFDDNNFKYSTTDKWNV